MKKPLRTDPIAEANRQWNQHGWDHAATGMAAVTSITRANQIFLKQVEQSLKPFDLSFARFELLRLLAFSTSHQLPMSSVTSRLQVHPASVTSVVDRLSADGLVERQAHPHDRRATILALTDQGATVTAQATTALNDEVFSKIDLSDADLQALVGILARLRAAAGDFVPPKPQPEALDQW